LLEYTANALRVLDKIFTPVLPYFDSAKKGCVENVLSISSYIAQISLLSSGKEFAFKTNSV